MSVTTNSKAGNFTGDGGGGGGSANWGGIGGTLANQADLAGELQNGKQQAVWGSITGALASQADLKAALDAKGSGGTWGSITGTLASQTDLKAALDAANQAASNAQTAANAAAPKFTTTDPFAGMTSAQILASGANVKQWFNGYSAGSPGTVARTVNFSFTPPAGGAALTYAVAIDVWGKVISFSPYS